MKALFWSSLLLIVITHAGYPLWIYLRALCRPRPIPKATVFPNTTVLLAVHNEAAYLSDKLRNLAALDYPRGLVEIIVVSDGSTDGTNGVLAEAEGQGIQSIYLREHRGKAGALNCGIAQARGEVVVFTDARQMLAASAVNNLVENFADSSIGCVSGELMIGTDAATSSAEGVGLYWRMEKKIRLWEGLAGSTVGATGSFYAVRRELLVPLPEGTILDDLYIPLHVARGGKRVVFEPGALAYDPLIADPKQEFRRKLRTLFGNYQLLQLAPWILTSSNPLRFEFICHKLLRLFVPFALLGLLISSAWLGSTTYGVFLVLQLLFYGLAGLSFVPLPLGILARLSSISLAFAVLNSAAALAFVYFISGRKPAWTR
jgi:cellulose synthase/poly-beta-1,6-N-acetylglucosamine synthase-like glycosyltransferase